MSQRVHHYMHSISPITRCGCGAVYNRSGWLARPFAWLQLWRQDQDKDCVEYRHCACGSTIGASALVMLSEDTDAVVLGEDEAGDLIIDYYLHSEVAKHD